VKYSDQRNSKRFKAKGGIALTSNGVCQVVNLSLGGLALKCFPELVFPPEWTMDIYDETGLNLQELKVKKIWTKRPDNPVSTLQSEVEVGGEFENLSSSQEAHLYSYILKLMVAEKQP